jgi:hypothetical protein
MTLLTPASTPGPPASLDFDCGVRAYSSSSSTGYWRLCWVEAGRRRETTAAGGEEMLAKAADVVARLAEGRPTPGRRLLGAGLSTSRSAGYWRLRWVKAGTGRGPPPPRATRCWPRRPTWWPAWPGPARTDWAELPARPCWPATSARTGARSEGRAGSTATKTNSRPTAAASCSGDSPPWSCAASPRAPAQVTPLRGRRSARCWSAMVAAGLDKGLVLARQDPLRGGALDTLAKGACRGRAGPRTLPQNR